MAFSLVTLFFFFLSILKMEKFNSWESEFVAELPKVELHLHLDGSLSTDFIGRRAKARGIDLPVPPNELRRWLVDQKIENLRRTKSNLVSSGPNSSGNWPVFDFCNQFLQTEEELKEAVVDLLERLSAPPNNVVYAEVRFSPKLHTKEGLSAEEALQAVIQGFRLGSRRLGIKGGVIVCALRSLSSDHGIEMATLAAKYLQRKRGDEIGVVGFDVAGDEGSYPLHSDGHSMYSGVKEAGRLGVPLTVHAGEWPEKFQTVKNVEFALNDLKVRRIGHAIALRSDENLLHRIKEDGNITIEVCLSSNVGLKYKVQSLDAHPVKLFYEEKVPFTLSSDNLLLSGDHDFEPSPFNEIMNLGTRVFAGSDVGWDAVKFSLKSGMNAAFSPDVQGEWRDKFDETVETIFKKYLPIRSL